jgi:DNA-binding response OmpR family regulator
VGDFTETSQSEHFTDPPHILIVEDNADTREMYAIFLSNLGCRVDQAEDAHRAIGYIATSSPDVAVVDIALPGMDGIELCRHIRHLARERSPVLVVITGLALGSADMARLHEAGVDLLLFKPCLPDALAAEVRLVLARSAYLQQASRALSRSVQAAAEESPRFS